MGVYALAVIEELEHHHAGIVAEHLWKGKEEFNLLRKQAPLRYLELLLAYQASLAAKRAS